MAKKSFFLIAPLLLLCATFSSYGSTATASSMEKMEYWHGEYHYPEEKNSRPPVNFDLSLIKVGKNIHGKITEPNTFGENGYSNLSANIKGTISKSGDVNFTKTYDGTAGVSHSVHYKGKLSKNKLVINGSWHIKNVSGSFSMKKMEK